MPGVFIRKAAAAVAEPVEPVEPAEVQEPQEPRPAPPLVRELVARGCTVVLTNNPGMLKLMKSLGFSVKSFPDDPDFRLVSHPL